jgi:hypothetical protein
MRTAGLLIFTLALSAAPAGAASNYVKRCAPDAVISGSVCTTPGR